MKTCYFCKHRLSVKEFSSNRFNLDGLNGLCDMCVFLKNKNHYYTNQERMVQEKREYRRNNRDIIRVNQKRYYERNRDKILAKNKTPKEREKNRIRHRNYTATLKGKKAQIKANRKYDKSERGQLMRKRYAQSKANLVKARIRVNKRRVQKLNATPNWLTETHLQQIEIMYELASVLEQLEGVRYAVDHVIPLQNKQVCGLHVPWNLQVLTHHENSVKHNKLLESL